MKFVIAGLAAVGLLLVNYSTSNADTQLFMSEKLGVEEESFLQWINEFGKSYPTKEEYHFRFVQFKKHMKQIAEHDESYHGNKVGFNEYSDNTEEEWKQMLGLKIDPNMKISENATQIEGFKSMDPLSAPDSFDWRSQGKVTSVKNQGRCGSCWAFAAIGTMETMFAIQAGLTGSQLQRFSEQNMVDCVRTSSCQGCNGGFFTYAWDHLKSMGQGITLEQLYPYTARDDACRPFTPYYYVQSYGWVQQSADGLRAALQHYPVAVGVEGENDGFRNHRGGIIEQGCGRNVDHAVFAVGYGVENGKQYFIVKNSWGTTWGESGYGRIAPDQCGITMYPAVVTLRN